MQSNLHQWVLLRLQILIDYTVVMVFFLALEGLGTESALSGFQAPVKPAGCWYFLSMASQIYSPEFQKSEQRSHGIQQPHVRAQIWRTSQFEMTDAPLFSERHYLQ